MSHQNNKTNWLSKPQNRLLSWNCTKLSNCLPSRCLMRSQTWPINLSPRLVNQTFSFQITKCAVFRASNCHPMGFQRVTEPQIEIFCADLRRLGQLKTCLRSTSLTLCKIVTKAVTWARLINKTQITFKTTLRVSQSMVVCSPLPPTARSNRTTCL